MFSRNVVGGMELRCPSCGALLYSQRARMCGQCGATLPPELVLSDEKAEAVAQERQWARDLAEKYDTTGRTPKTEAYESPRARYEAAEADPGELIAPISCAAEFKHRKRRWFWLLMGVEAWLAFLLLLSTRLILQARLPWYLWLLAIGFILLRGYFFWLRASPLCPNCKQNIRTCLTNYCHVCGKSTSHRRCTDCGVDNTWTGWFRPYQNGAYQWIKYCPDCGVELDTRIPRWRAGRQL